MIVTTRQLQEKYSYLSNKMAKISRDIKSGKLFPLVKGIYETDANVNGAKLAQFIYGPSYLSYNKIVA